MNLKGLCILFIGLFTLLMLVISPQGVAWADATQDGHEALRPICVMPGFPCESPVSIKKPICAGLDCPPSNSEQITKESTGITSKANPPKQLDGKKPCICEGTEEICNRMCGTPGSRFGD